MDRHCLRLPAIIVLLFVLHFGYSASYASAAAEQGGVESAQKNSDLRSMPQALQAAFSSAVGHDDPAYAVSRTAHRYHGNNARNNLSMDFSSNGVTMRSGNSQWGLKLNKFGYGTDMHAVASTAPKVTANQVEYLYGGIREWYVNGPLGLEQGFTIDSAPADKKDRGPLTLELTSSGDLTPAMDVAGTGLRLKKHDGTQILRYCGLSAVDATGRHLHAWLEVDGLRLLVRVDDAEAQYPVVVDPIVEQQTELADPSGGEYDFFGWSVALSGDGNTALIGTAYNEGNYAPGSAYVFTRSGTAWTQQQKLTASDGVALDEFGNSVALSGDGNTALIGAPSETVNGSYYVGAAYVFTRSGTAWTQQQKLTASDGVTDDAFGWSVALSGDGNTALIGAPYHTVGTYTLQGVAYAFTYSTATSWTQQQKLTEASNGAAHDYFGYAVALSGDGNTALIGAYGSNDKTGLAYAFTYSAPSWSLQQILHALDGEVPDTFGEFVALSANGNTALIGAPFKTVGTNTSQGVAYAFTYSTATSWTQQQELTASDGAEYDNFGWPVALSGDGSTAIIGAPYHTVGTYDQGAAYVFTYSGETLMQQELTASDAAEYDLFGYAVALSGDGNTAIIGAPEKTVNYNSIQGAAYVYLIQGLPTLTTTAISNITSTTASGGGNVTSNGGYPPITGEGVCWSTSIYPSTIFGSCTQDGTVTPFTSSITGLTAGQTYHVRAYATSSEGTGYGDDTTFFTLCGSYLLKVEPQGYLATGIQDAINNASASGPVSIIDVNSFDYVENPVFSNNVPIIVEGGLDCSLLSVVGYTEIDGQVIINGTASVVFENVIVGS